MSESGIIIARADDWMGIYAKGLLMCEGHSIPDEELIRVGQDYPSLSIQSKEVDYDWMHDEGCFPQNIEDVKFQ